METWWSDSGYSLAELLVATAAAGLLMAGVFGVYQASQQSYGVATAQEEALIVGRAALDRMASDLRTLGAGWVKPGGAILSASPTDITFLADVNSDTLDSEGIDLTLAEDALSGSTVVRVSASRGFSREEFLQVADGAVMENRLVTSVAGRTLTLQSGLSTSYPAGSLIRSVETVSYALDAGGTLRRTVGGSGAQPQAKGVRSLMLRYWDDGDPPREIFPTTQADRDGIRQITVRLTVLLTGGGSSVSRTIEASVRPRNLF